MFDKEKIREFKIITLIIFISVICGGVGYYTNYSLAQVNTFQESVFVNGLVAPTAMEFAPDGRLFVAEKDGKLRVIKNGALLSVPFVSLNVTSNSERGLLGIAFDPNFAGNRFIYVYYTRTASPIKNRVSRFTASLSNPDVAEPNSEVVILDNIGSDAGNHNGGAIHFGKDGKLYIAVGDGGSNSSNSQSLGTLSGKLLRINSDGTIPTDNPLVSTAGARGEVWALGLRNPFTFSVDLVSGKIHINDVGQSTFEEVNLGVKGANYGWPTCEGPCTNSGFTNPIYHYGRSVGQAITGGAFYRGSTFPSTYSGVYFFSDYLGGFIKYLNSSNQVFDFRTAQSPVDLKVGPDGSLYYASINNGIIYKISYISASNRIPVAVISAQPTSGNAPLAVSFSGSGSSDPDGDTLTYSWNFGDGSQTVSGISAGKTYNTSGRYTAILTVSDGRGGSSNASILIDVGSPPVVAINTPTIGTMYSAGDTINFSGSGTDAQDGILPVSAFSWMIVFYHGNHTHPFLGPINGSKNGSFTIPRTGEVDHDVWYRITLTVTDSSGLIHQVSRDVMPRKSTITLNSNPTGLSLTFDGQPRILPFVTLSVVGFTHILGAVSPQTLNGKSYQFVSWSDNGIINHSINTLAVNTTYTAVFNEIFTPTPTPIPTPIPGTDRTPPTISSVTITEITPFAATIKWTTNEPANGQIAFCTTYLPGCTNSTPLVPDLVTQHTINLSGLSPNTTYYMWIKSKDVAGNAREFYRTFRTTVGTTTPTPTPTPGTTSTPTPTPGTDDRTPPTISGVTVTEITPFTAIIKWTTNEPANGQIAFCTTYLPDCSNSTPLVPDLITQHTINLSGLTPNTSYYMWIKSKDASGNLRTFYKVLRTGSISTPTPTPRPDSIPPYISNATVTEITPFTATVRWVTNELADGQVAFCTIYIVGCPNKTPLVSELTLEHTINLSGLTPNTYYFMWIFTKDAAGNQRSYFKTFRTTAGEPTPTPTPTPPFPTPTNPFPSPTPTPGTDRTPPTISSVTITEITPFTATIKWTTNEPADGQIAFCTTYLPDCSNSTPLAADLTTQHTINLSGLTPNTTYYMWIKSKDAAGNLRTFYRTFRTGGGV